MQIFYPIILLFSRKQLFARGASLILIEYSCTFWNDVLILMTVLNLLNARIATNRINLFCSILACGTQLWYRQYKSVIEFYSYTLQRELQWRIVRNDYKCLVDNVRNLFFVICKTAGHRGNGH